MRVKIEMENSEGSTVTVFEGTVESLQEAGTVQDIIKSVCTIEEKIRQLIEGKAEAVLQGNRDEVEKRMSGEI